MRLKVRFDGAAPTPAVTDTEKHMVLFQRKTKWRKLSAEIGRARKDDFLGLLGKELQEKLGASIAITKGNYRQGSDIFSGIVVYVSQNALTAILGLSATVYGATKSLEAVTNFLKNYPDAKKNFKIFQEDVVKCIARVSDRFRIAKKYSSAKINVTKRTVRTMIRDATRANPASLVSKTKLLPPPDKS